MFALPPKVTPAWVVTFLFWGAACVGHLQAASPAPIAAAAASASAPAASAPAEDPLQLGMVAYERGDFAKAIAMLEKPASAGDRDALYYLGEAVYFHTARENHVRHAYQVHKLGVAAGDPRAQFRVAEMLAMGIPVPQDIDGSLNLLRKAADQGFTPAKFALTQVYKARATARLAADRLDASKLAIQADSSLANVESILFGVDVQTYCADAKAAVVLARAGNELYGQLMTGVVRDNYNTEPDGVITRPLLSAMYAHVIAAERNLFKSCTMSRGLPRTWTTTGRRIADDGLIELKDAAVEDAAEGVGAVWLLPNVVDAAGHRLGIDVGPGYFSMGHDKLYGCPREVAMQIVSNGGAKPELVKKCLPLRYGDVATTGRSLKVTRGGGGEGDSPQTETHLLPELVVIGQFGKVFYLNRVELEKN